MQFCKIDIQDSLSRLGSFEVTFISSHSFDCSWKIETKHLFKSHVARAVLKRLSTNSSNSGIEMEIIDFPQLTSSISNGIIAPNVFNMCFTIECYLVRSMAQQSQSYNTSVTWWLLKAHTVWNVILNVFRNGSRCWKCSNLGGLFYVLLNILSAKMYNTSYFEYCVFSMNKIK